jgi:hypothetical protein
MARLTAVITQELESILASDLKFMLAAKLWQAWSASLHHQRSADTLQIVKQHERTKLLQWSVEIRCKHTSSWPYNNHQTVLYSSKWAIPCLTWEISLTPDQRPAPNSERRKKYEENHANKVARTA